MSLSLGIVGLPNVGKSTLFNALTKKGVLAANYPFATIDPSVGVVAVPDERVQILSDFSKSAKTIPAAVEFVDIAGLVKGAAEGEGLGNKFLSHIREVDAIAQVVRIFEDPGIIHVENKVDPISDITTINLELVIADKETVSKRINNLDKEVKKVDPTSRGSGGASKALVEQATLKKVEVNLNNGELASKTDLNEDEKMILKSMNLLTMKPILYVLNTSEAAEGNKREAMDKIPGPYVEVDPVFETGLNDLIKKSYEMLNLITYFTTGEDETRAWTIKKGWTAPEAGTAIHTDFKDKFIKAEVVFWKDLIDSGSYGAAREKGLVRTEGKEYIVKDGDVIEFKI